MSWSSGSGRRFAVVFRPRQDQRCRHERRQHGKGDKGRIAPGSDGETMQRRAACRAEEHRRHQPLAAEIGRDVGYPGLQSCREKIEADLQAQQTQKEDDRIVVVATTRLLMASTAPSSAKRGF